MFPHSESRIIITLSQRPLKCGLFPISGRVSDDLPVSGYCGVPQSARRAMPAAWGVGMTRHPKLGAVERRKTRIGIPVPFHSD